MKVGIVTTWFERGAAYVSKNIETALSRQHEVYIYARGGESYAIDNPEWARSNVTWGHKSQYPLLTYIDISDFKKWLKVNNIEAVIFNEQHWWPPVLLCVDMGVLVGTYVDYYTEETIPLFGCYDFLICNTRRHQDIFKWHKQSKYIPWGTDTTLFKPQNRRRDAGPITFFHSAGMNPQRKGTDLLIQAFSCVDEDARLIIHSQVNLRKAVPTLEPVINELISQNRLELIEKTVGAPGLYNLGDVYVYPSRLDGLGLSVVEALACGLPVITTNAAPMNEFVNSSIGTLVNISRIYARSDGYYWPKSDCDIRDLSKSIASYIGNPKKLEDERKNARLMAETHYDWASNAKILLDFFNSAQVISPSEKSFAIEGAKSYERKKMGSRPICRSVMNMVINTLFSYH